MKIPVIKGNIKQHTLQFQEKNEIQNTLKDQIGPNESMLVAISGGPDSMMTAVLMYNFFIINKYSLQNLFFIHFNHKIRPESDQEEVFVKKYFTGTNLTCISKSSSSKNKEADLRSRRYTHINKLSNKHKIKFVILGHNLGDRIESTFLNLIRGAGLKGFLSMNFIQHHNLLPGIQVIRPLITLSKPYITQICKKNTIPYVTDPSNDDEKTSLRNKLRNKILPEIYALSNTKKGQETFEKSMFNIYKEIEKTKHEKCPPLTKGGVGGICKIDQSPYRKAKFAYERKIPQKEINNENIIEILNHLGIYKDISSALLHQLSKFLQISDAGYTYFQKTYFFIAHRKIYIIQAPKDFRKKDLGPAQLGIKDIKKIEEEIYRYPKKTDRYKGKTRNQYCITQKIPLFRRNFIAVLEKDGKIVKVIRPIS